MVGLDSKVQLAQEISAGASDNFAGALKASDAMSLSHVREVLEEQIAPTDPTLCHRFIEQWLESLTPIQKLAASMEVSHLYLLDLVGVPHAEDIVLSRILDNGADAIGAIRSEILSYRDLGRNPDSSFGLKFVKNLEADAGDPLGAVIESFRSNSERLRQLIHRADDEMKSER